MRRLLALSLLTVLPAIEASAQCLPDSLRSSFESQLVSLFAASDLDIDQLEAHAHDRLGFGLRPGNTPDTRTVAERRAALAAGIADSLGLANEHRNNVDEALAALRLTSSNPDVPTDIYRHADTTMTESYSELEVLRRRIRAATNQTERDRLRGLRNRVLSSIRESTASRALAQLMVSRSLDTTAVLGEFWANHFNISSTKSTWAAIDYQKTLSRRACGTFRELLTASAKHPAMSMYLDNFSSTANAINENYARELLELHTFGDDRLRFYRQNDVRNVARVLTGWGIGFQELDRDTFRPRFQFYAASHDGAAINLFNSAPQGVLLRVPAAAMNSNNIPTSAAVSRGELLLDYLANHTATRNNICRKLAIRLHGTAPADLVSACAANGVWGNGGGDLGAVYRFLLTRPRMWNAETYQRKDKNPIELIVSAHRRTGRAADTIITVPFLRLSLKSIEMLGIHYTDVGPPTGYEDENIWRSAGEIFRFTPILFANLDTSALGLRVNNRVLRGADLDTFLRAELNAAAASANPSVARRTLAARLSTEVLRYPSNSLLTVPSIEGTFLYPDRVSGGDPTLMRSFVETALASRQFLRK